MRLVQLALVAAAGAASYFAYEKWFRKDGQEVVLDTTGGVSRLEKDADYDAQVLLDHLGTLDPMIAAGWLKAYLQQVGFVVTSLPTLASDEDSQKFMAGTPALWLVTCKWTLPQGYIAGPAPVPVKSMRFIKLPIRSG